MEQIREILVKQREAGAKCKGEEKGKECLPELSTAHPHIVTLFLIIEQIC